MTAMQPVSSHREQSFTPPRPKAAPAAPKATPKPPENALHAFQDRCKAKLVEKAQSNPQNAPYWQRYAVSKGWILPNEGIEAILGNVTQVFTLDWANDVAGNIKAVQEQFLAHEKEVAALAEQGSLKDLPSESIGGASDAADAGCPNCGHHTVIMSKDYDGTMYCQACAWQWDIETGDYYEEHPWARAVCPIPPKGTAKKDYDQQPMTLGQIARLDHKRFYGLVMNNQEAKGWVGRDGKQRPPSQSDIDFAEACKAAVFHMEQDKDQDGDAHRESDIPH